MEPVIYSLSDMIEDYGQDYAQTALSLFDCSKEPDVQEFLKQKALEFERNHLTRTFFICDAKSKSNDTDILAFFSLALSQPLTTEWSNSQKRKWARFQQRDYLNAILIAQLGKNFHVNQYPNYQNKINLQFILDYAEQQIGHIHRLIPFEVIVLDTKKFLISKYKAKKYKQLSEHGEADQKGQIQFKMMKKISHLISKP